MRKVLFLAVVLTSILCYTSCIFVKKDEFDAPKRNIIDTSSVLNYQIDSIMLPIPSFSGSGFFRIENDKILFFDDSFLQISVFGQKGNFLDYKLGMGSGDTEINAFRFYIPTKNQNIFLQTDYEFKIYDKTWKNTGKSFKWNWLDRASVINAPSPDNPNMYDINWQTPDRGNKDFPVNSRGDIYFPVHIIGGVSKQINKFTSIFYEKGNPIGVIDSKTGTLKQVFGRYPKIYTEKKYLTLFSYNSMAIKNDSLFVQYAASPEIYVYSPDHEPVYSFGTAGKGISTNYPLISNENEYANQKELNIPAYGIYTALYIDAEKNLIFRTYTKQYSLNSGLQIYRNDVLIADITVPYKFNIVGKIGSTYFADGIIDKKGGKLGIYKLDLK